MRRGKIGKGDRQAGRKALRKREVEAEGRTIYERG